MINLLQLYHEISENCNIYIYIDFSSYFKKYYFFKYDQLDLNQHQFISLYKKKLYTYKKIKCYTLSKHALQNDILCRPTSHCSKHSLHSKSAKLPHTVHCLGAENSIQLVLIYS